MSNTDTAAVDAVAPRDLADCFATGCACVALDRAELKQQLATQLDADMAAKLTEALPGLFANVAVFLPAQEYQAMLELVSAAETTLTLPTARAELLASSEPIAHRDHGPAGVFMGYDFHRNGAEPKLIEINTNAGGAFLHALQRSAQQYCCPEIETVLGVTPATTFDDDVMAMFRQELQRQRGDAKLTRIAIVDTNPEQQFLYPEFELAKHLFQQHGIETVITDPGALTFDAHHLLWQGKPIDLVYNRLTDFLLQEEACRPLREAYDNNAVVVTPNPHNYVLHADKRNLITLTDPETLQRWGVPASLQKVLGQRIPKTIAVTVANAETLWQQRRQWFFKPAQGFGSKATYRGEKLTRGTWEQILNGNYVAQQFSPPSEQQIEHDEVPVTLKSDLRLYCYRGKPLMIAARLYQGQTTNLRTPGGGFAPVYVLPEQ